jgi:hypothetical protein
MASKIKEPITDSQDVIKKNNFIMDILVVLGIIVLGLTLVYLMNYFFVKKSYIKINMSTDKKIEYIMLEGQQELVTTQKYVSDLDYSMRYDVNNFKVFKYKKRDIYKFLHNDVVLVVVEKSVIPNSCTMSLLKTGYNNCYVQKDDFTEEYYISTNGVTYKITVKMPNTTEYKEGVRTRIDYMINTFVINF